MSLENEIKKLTAAVEANTLAILSGNQPTTMAGVPKQPSQPEAVAATPSQPATPAPVAEVPPQPPVEQATVAPTAPPQPPTHAATEPVTQPKVAMTPEELNAALVVEFNRLGDRTGIDKAMADLGVSSVTQLQPAQYDQLLTAVRAL